LRLASILKQVIKAIKIEPPNWLKTPEGAEKAFSAFSEMTSVLQG
jgi:hypothetical protein